jgi:AcrR family transcriptional regulator
LAISSTVWYREVPSTNSFYGTHQYHVKDARVRKPKDCKPASPLDALEPRRRAILEAAFAVLMERGYAGASTLEIARRARVSKRELYAEFGSKSGMLQALITATATHMRLPLADGDVGDRKALQTLLQRYGSTALTELTRKPVLAINRLAIAEAGRSPELGRILEQHGREPTRRALVEVMAKAKAAGVLGRAEPEVMAGQFFSLLMGDLMNRLLLGVVEPPAAREIGKRAEAATTAFLALNTR